MTKNAMSAITMATTAVLSCSLGMSDILEFRSHRCRLTLSLSGKGLDSLYDSSRSLEDTMRYLSQLRKVLVTESFQEWKRENSLVMMLEMRAEREESAKPFLV